MILIVECNWVEYNTGGLLRAATKSETQETAGEDWWTNSENISGRRDKCEWIVLMMLWYRRQQLEMVWWRWRQFTRLTQLWVTPCQYRVSSLRMVTGWTSWGQTTVATRAGWRRWTGPRPALSPSEPMVRRRVLADPVYQTRLRVCHDQPATPASTITRMDPWPHPSSVKGKCTVNLQGVTKRHPVLTNKESINYYLHAASKGLQLYHHQVQTKLRQW